MIGWRVWLGICLLAALAGYGLGRAPGSRDAPAMPSRAAPPPVPVGVVQPELRVMTERLDALGTLKAEESVLLSPEIAGRIARIHFTEGQPVAAGAPLVDLDDAEWRQALEKSRAEERVQHLNFERAAALRQRNLVSTQQVDEIEARWRVARAQSHQDEVRLARMHLKAPFSGVAGLRRVSVGEWVQAGQVLAGLEATKRMKVDFKIPEEYAMRLSPGQALDVAVDALPGRAFAGVVYALDPHLDETTRSVLLRGRLDNPDDLLRPGMFARLGLALGAGREAMLIPEHAVMGLGSRKFVFVVVDGRAVRREVQTGTHREGQVEVLTGLDMDVTLVVDGQMKLRDGALVAVIPER